MDGPLLHGDQRVDQDLRASQRAAAAWVEAFARTGYGPHGGTKLVAADPPQLMRSPAAALLEAPPEPALAPYRDLARRVLAHAGDGATTAILLAAGLVRRALDADVAAATFVQGYPLARRQALAVLDALAAPCAPAAALATLTTGGEAWAQALLAGFPEEGVVDLDDVEVVAEPGELPVWLDGVPLEPRLPPRAGAGGVLLLTSSWSPKPRHAARWSSKAVGHATMAEDALRREAARRVQGLGVGLVACAGGLDEGLAGHLADLGIGVATDVPRSRLRRLADATGSQAVPAPTEAARSDVGAGTWRRRDRRRGGWLVSGAKPARTLAMPAHGATWASAAVADGERLLRAAGRVLLDPRGVPGAGAWQGRVAASLRQAADAAPGRTPIALQAAADGVAGLARALHDNAAGQRLDACQDPYPCVRLAVAAAFDCAHAVLRVDARLDKRASTPARLRGGLGRAGSPKGLPGDLPPLM